MRPMHGIRRRLRSWRLLLGVTAGVLLTAQFGGCYYVQAVSGQLELLRKREPITELVQQSELSDEKRARLRMVLEARQFAVDELKLPDNDSYRSYADLGRDYVVWNVFAAPEFSLQPKTWCFLVVGCVAYRGYFAEPAARKHADKLARDGLDVHVGGVPAYSTLGRFDDPLLNTMLRWSDAELVSTLFHELAHQRLFVKGDTGFNESYATAVAEAGLERWLTAREQAAELQTFAKRDDLRRALTALAEDTKAELAALYADDQDDEFKRHRKRELLDRLSMRASDEATRSGFKPTGWWNPPLNNARLLSVSLYRGNLDAFRTLFERCEQRFECLHAEAEQLAELDAPERERALAEISESSGRYSR